MSEQVDAIYEHGILRPLTPLLLPDRAHVRVTVTPLAEQECDDTGDKSQSVSFEAELENLLFDGPSLPPGFSRADIYADHD